MDQRLTHDVLAAFDRRLNRESTAPIGVAFSGGGDSLMALKAAADWASRHGRTVTVFHVDHRLQPASAEWARQAEMATNRLGARFIGLAWTGDKPATGLPAAAREARHRLIADASRAASVGVVVFGHTADDRIEADLMRRAGHRMGTLREWSPSPAWPEGRGLFVLRPLLDLRRAAIRSTLAAEGETWIDDPANTDPRSPRARVRPAAAETDIPPPEPDDGPLAMLAEMAVIGEGGNIRIDRDALRSLARGAARRLVGAALACASGTAGAARGERLEALTGRLIGQAAFTATLSGAKTLAGREVMFVRDTGEARRGGLEPLALAPRETGVWDGRFDIAAGPAAVTVTHLAGHAASLSRDQRGLLKGVPAPVRPGLPVILSRDCVPACPILAGTSLAEMDCVEIKLLVADRFRAACGVILKEPAT